MCICVYIYIYIYIYTHIHRLLSTGPALRGTRVAAGRRAPLAQDPNSQINVNSNYNN